MKKFIILSLGMILVLSGCDKTNTKINGKNVLSMDDAKKKVTTFINEQLLPPDSKNRAVVKNIKESDGLYSLDVLIGGQKISSYMTKTGDKFFPQVIDMNKKKNEKKQANNSKSEESVVSKKSDKPKVDLFVMSYCPFGTQIEKGILPVVDLLKNKIDFNVKFCDYSMHQKKELDEELNQYCIEKEQGDKYLSYLKCFLQNSNSAKCVKDSKINKAKLDKCVASTDKKYKITENYNNKSTWKGNFPTFNIYKDENKEYGVSGSPTLVINGEKVRSDRNPSALLKVICSAFTDGKKPKECEEKLSSKTPSTGFGGGTGADNNASCN